MYWEIRLSFKSLEICTFKFIAKKESENQWQIKMKMEKSIDSDWENKLMWKSKGWNFKLCSLRWYHNIHDQTANKKHLLKWKLIYQKSKIST